MFREEGDDFILPTVRVKEVSLWGLFEGIIASLYEYVRPYEGKKSFKVYLGRNEYVIYAVEGSEDPGPLHLADERQLGSL